MSHPALRFDGVSRHYGAVRAVDGVDLAVEPGELFCLLGPSGCGKTTLLELAGGYQIPTSGRVLLAGNDATSFPPERRNIGMVFQSYALFGHLTAHANIAFGLKMRGVSRAEQARRVGEMLEVVGLTDDEARRKPRRLSGGQQQRVALARALVIHPDVLLLDEPFANLDLALRQRLRGETRDVQRHVGTATMLVTHDQEEAFEMADRIAVLFDGKVAQLGTPEELYDRPATRRVAEFVGAANFFDVTQYSGDEVIAGPLRARARAKPGDALMLRPEQLVIAQNGTLRGEVRSVRFRGADREVEVEVDGHLLRTIAPRLGPNVGEIVGLNVIADPWVVSA